MRYPFQSKEAHELNIQIFETLYYGALEASCEIAIEKGPYTSYKCSPVNEGVSIQLRKILYLWLLTLLTLFWLLTLLTLLILHMKVIEI